MSDGDMLGSISQPIQSKGSDRYSVISESLSGALVMDRGFPGRLSGRLNLGFVTAVVLLGFGLGGSSHQASSQNNRIDLALFQMTFDESFDHLDVSAWGPGTRWIAHTPWNGDFGDAQFANPTPDFPFTIERGILRIEARRGPDGTWRSGLLSSTDHYGNGFSQKFGYFEMRAKLPQGPGLWPAFWLIANKQEDTSAEIDILEHYGKFPDMYESVVHVWKKTEGGRSYQKLIRHQIPAGSLYQDFHVYGASIDAEWIIFYFDHIEMARTPTPAEHHHPMFILVNLAMGAGWPIDQTPNPSVMEIDYIRAYTKIEGD